MSIISKNKNAAWEAKCDYQLKLAELRAMEHDAMNDMLNVLRKNEGKPMTAKEIKEACAYDLSTHEIAGNIVAMKKRESRYFAVYKLYGRSLPVVDVPRTDVYGKNGERFVIKEGGKRRARVAELDEDNKVIPETIREVMLREPHRYGIVKT